MFMLYEIFIWNCFAKLLYFCMNVFFIGIRNSYLTLARLLCLICWFSSWVMLYYCETPFFFIFFLDFFVKKNFHFFFWLEEYIFNLPYSYTDHIRSELWLKHCILCFWTTSPLPDSYIPFSLEWPSLEKLALKHKPWWQTFQFLLGFFLFFFLPAPRKVSVKSRYSSFKSKNDWLLRAS